MSAATSKDPGGDYNSISNLVARDRGIPGTDSGSFTYSAIYRDFITATFQGIQLSGLAANFSYDVTFYAYDNSGSRTQTFTDATPGSTGLSGTVTYSAASAFNSSTPNNSYSTTINAKSDAQGRLYFTESGVGTGGSSSVALFNAVMVDSIGTPPVTRPFYHAYNGNFNDSGPSANNGIPTGTAAITTDPAFIASGSGALALDGTDGSYVSLTNPVSFNATEPWSVSWWARRAAIGTNKGMVMGNASNTLDFIWLNDTFTGLRFRSSTAATFDFTTPKDELLRHYSLVADGTGNLSLYLNGAFSETLTGSTFFTFDSIGKAYPTDTLHYNFQGSLDEIHLFDSALSAPQVAALYNSEKPAAPVTRLRIVLLGGQSNADGRATISGLPTTPVNLQSPQSDVDFFYKVEGGTATLTTLRPGLSETSQFGPEITLGRKMANLRAGEAGTRVAIIKYANGGTNLITQWKGGGDGTTANDGPEFVVFQQTVTSGLAALAAAYPSATLELQGMVWLQGESDATVSAAPSYQANLAAFISDVRSTYGTDLPFIIARLSSGQTNLNSTYLNQIRAAQDAVAAADPRTGIILTDSLGLNGDNLHFNASGQQSIGSGFSDELAYYRWMIDTFTAAQINAGVAEPGADQDGDGKSNRAEFIGASDPSSGTSTFAVAFARTGPSTGEISYPTSAARIYSVEHYLEIGGTWETQLPPLQGTGVTAVRPLATSSPRGIYRVRVGLP